MKKFAPAQLNNWARPWSAGQIPVLLDALAAVLALPVELATHNE